MTPGVFWWGLAIIVIFAVAEVAGDVVRFIQGGDDE